MNEDSPMTEENLGYSSLTLRQLLIWAKNPMQQLQCICDIAQACENKSGGAVLSAACPFFHHGDPFVQKTVMSLLSTVSILINFVYLLFYCKHL